MTKIAKISLDIRKDNIIDNEPIVLRQGDSDVTIEASISNDGYPDFEISFATFVAKKSDGTIISNDPANVNGNVISYPISKHLTESVGKIQDAYFMINNQITTCGFDISVIPSTQLDSNSVNYIPGIENINKFLESAEADWLGRIQQMKAQIDGSNVPDEFKLLMDKTLSDAKAQYQPTIDAAEKNVENIAADLAAKKLDLTNNSDQLNQTITNIKAQVSSITSFLDNVQKQIIDANSSFTTGQQAQISQSIADSQKKLADSIASMQNEVAQTVADLKNSSNSAITDMQNSQSTAMAKVNQDITDTEAIIQKMQYSAVGTNLYQDTRDFDNSSLWPGFSNWYKTGEKFNGLTVIATDQDWNGLEQTVQAKKGETYTFSVYARYKSGTGQSMMFFNVNGSDMGTPVSLNETWQRVTYTMTLTNDSLIRAHIDRANNNTNTLLIAGPKLEKGSIATDYSLNPEEIATNDDVTNQIKASQPDLSGFQKASDVQTAISNALSDAKAQIKDSIAGTNMLMNTDAPFSMTGNNTPNQIQKMYTLSRRLGAGTTVTISFDAVSTAPAEFTSRINRADDGDEVGVFTCKADTTKDNYSVTLTMNEVTDVDIFMKLDNVPSTTKITISNMKLQIDTDISNALKDLKTKN